MFNKGACNAKQWPIHMATRLPWTTQRMDMPPEAIAMPLSGRPFCKDQWPNNTLYNSNLLDNGLPVQTM